MSDRKAGLDREAMRRMVREVLRDALPEAIKGSAAAKAAAQKVVASASVAARAEPAAKTAASGVSPSQARQSAGEEVSLQSDQELAQFVRRIVHLLENPATREAVKSGRHGFRLKRSSSSSPVASAGRPAGAVEKIAKGVVKENTVVDAAKAGARLVIGRGVVVTPLARDKARQLGVQIERDV